MNDYLMDNYLLDVISPEIVIKTIIVLEDWFWAIERGEANLRLVDPFGERYSLERVDKIIKMIDEYIDNQLLNISYWRNKGNETKGKPIDTPADFSRLEGASREAFVQAVKNVI